jgi:hypothetical protein
MSMLRKNFPTPLTLIAAIGFLPMPAVAQITNPITANIPFPFTVVDTQLPSGTYTIRAVNDTDLNAMEIVSADGKTHVFFLAGQADLPSPATKTEVEFHKYGDREFLSYIFERGAVAGAEADTGQAELRLISKR